MTDGDVVLPCHRFPRAPSVGPLVAPRFPWNLNSMPLAFVPMKISWTLPWSTMPARPWHDWQSLNLVIEGRCIKQLIHGCCPRAPCINAPGTICTSWTCVARKMHHQASCICLHWCCLCSPRGRCQLQDTPCIKMIFGAPITQKI